MSNNSLLPETNKENYIDYQKTEKGNIINKENKSKNLIKWAHGFPDRYSEGMLNIGYQTIYFLINKHPNFFCERFFLEDKNHIKTIETKQPLKNFDIVSFSMPFEMLYGNLIDILERSRIPLWSKDRDESLPILIGGGLSVTTNPEPLADVFDVLVIGEAEGIMTKILNIISDWKKKKKGKKELLLNLTNIEGVYIPSLYKVVYLNKKIKTIEPIIKSLPKKINKLYQKDINYETKFIISPKTSWPNFCFIEISRGCKYRCKFCLLSHAYGKPRFRDIKSIIDSARKLRKYTDKIRLVSASEDEHPQIIEIMERLKKLGFKITIGSQRADFINDHFLKFIDNDTFTVAPEVGIEKFRMKLRKTIKDDDIEKSVKMASKIKKIKKLQMFFIVGFPEEKIEDIKAIAKMTIEIRKLLDSCKRDDIEILLCINCLIMKPYTPFQWERQCNEHEYKKKIEIIRKELERWPQIKIKTMKDDWIIIQSLLTRGDRRAFKMFYDIHKNNSFLKKNRNKIDFYLKEKDHKDFLPWGIISET
jgi:radical SAM superfamily enzyme YgiQ (UPF0313 family)